MVLSAHGVYVSGCRGCGLLLSYQKRLPARVHGIFLPRVLRLGRETDGCEETHKHFLCGRAHVRRDTRLRCSGSMCVSRVGRACGVSGRRRRSVRCMEAISSLSAGGGQSPPGGGNLLPSSWLGGGRIYMPTRRARCISFAYSRISEAFSLSVHGERPQADTLKVVS